jgi:hypothetical protein
VDDGREAASGVRPAYLLYIRYAMKTSKAACTRPGQSCDVRARLKDTHQRQEVAEAAGVVLGRRLDIRSLLRQSTLG